MHIKLWGMIAYNNMHAKNVHLYTHSTPGIGSKGKNIFFSEYGHVIYQIKGNETYNKMQANILPLHTFNVKR